MVFLLNFDCTFGAAFVKTITASRQHDDDDDDNDNSDAGQLEIFIMVK